MMCSGSKFLVSGDRSGGRSCDQRHANAAAWSGASIRRRFVIEANRWSRAGSVVGAFAIAFIMLIGTRGLAQQTVDQILTLVNDDLITRIDLLWSIAMDPQAPSPAGPVGSDL